ncbi:hypothetical protein D0Y65_050329 [Glycine soja]|uniref:Uncharacterized protein n=1 Tax=Glycine soja TaxID=3848 RepID=A0A445FBP5_GLYSO|nr:hypothetical protein D0Y65_050329 [Glycine soja]
MNKGLSFVLLILLIHYNNVVNANNKNCVTEDCLIGNNDLESEFYFGSHVARMLYDVSQSVSGQTGNSNNKAVNCPQSNGYRTCLPSKNGGGPNQSCGDYTRWTMVLEKLKLRGRQEEETVMYKLKNIGISMGILNDLIPCT